VPATPAPAPTSVTPSSDAGASACASDASVAAPGCRSHADCSTAAVCVEGVCRTRCAAPCDCRAGDACTGGVCLPSPTPSEGTSASTVGSSLAVCPLVQ
jgi:hypothetical protein